MAAITDSMDHGHGHEPGLNHQYEDMAQQSETYIVGMWSFLVSEVMSSAHCSSSTRCTAGTISAISTSPMSIWMSGLAPSTPLSCSLARSRW